MRTLPNVWAVPNVWISARHSEHAVGFPYIRHAIASTKESPSGSLNDLRGKAIPYDGHVTGTAEHRQEHPAPRVIAHRGASGYRPEHSRAAYELAIEQGADAIEPDVVVSADGELVLRHENALTDTTDVAEHPEFADRRTTKTVDGIEHTGWFAEDFTWLELRTLRLRERIPPLRPANTEYTDERMLRLEDLLALLEGTGVTLVAELKHPTYFASIGHDLGALFAERMRASGWADRPDRVVVECFEESVLHEVRARGVQGRLVYLMMAGQSAPDLVERDGAAALTYRDQLLPGQLVRLRERGIDGISLSKGFLLEDGADALIERMHGLGFDTFTFTLRPENAFLDERFRSAEDTSGDVGVTIDLAEHGIGTGRASVSWLAEHGRWQDEWRAIMSTGVRWVFVDHPDLPHRITRD